jgi:hypothetical protein
VADEQEPANELDREQVISLIAKHAKQLAALARKQRCTTLSYILQTAAEQAERDLVKPRGKRESGIS